MGEKWVGITVTSDKLQIVQLEFGDENDIFLNGQSKWDLQQGDRPNAYKVMYKTIADHLNENNIQHVVVKGSAANQAGMRLAHLEAAELRGVVMAAAASSSAKLTVWTKAKVSKTFGKRKADAYLDDDDFWANKLDSFDLKKIYREAALLILAVKKNGK